MLRIKTAALVACFLQLAVLCHGNAAEIAKVVASANVESVCTVSCVNHPFVTKLPAGALGERDALAEEEGVNVSISDLVEETSMVLIEADAEEGVDVAGAGEVLVYNVGLSDLVRDGPRALLKPVLQKHQQFAFKHDGREGVQQVVVVVQNVDDPVTRTAIETSLPGQVSALWSELAPMLRGGEGIQARMVALPSPSDAAALEAGVAKVRAAVQQAVSEAPAAGVEAKWASRRLLGALKAAFTASPTGGQQQQVEGQEDAVAAMLAVEDARAQGQKVVESMAEAILDPDLGAQPSVNEDFGSGCDDIVEGILTQYDASTEEYKKFACRGEKRKQLICDIMRGLYPRYLQQMDLAFKQAMADYATNLGQIPLGDGKAMKKMQSLRAKTTAEFDRLGKCVRSKYSKGWEEEAGRRADLVRDCNEMIDDVLIDAKIQGRPAPKCRNELEPISVDIHWELKYLFGCEAARGALFDKYRRPVTDIGLIRQLQLNPAATEGKPPVTERTFNEFDNQKTFYQKDVSRVEEI
eukprot:CAMPEP_0113938316 /NCGR_PEP_ID=MMETSP1339-20121228/4745_1 /TAXON_ID=94617 /ORGANISM="Fibrocapsa japonica" /LENGTH=523 /DNA_ID=CAMNT_0000941375 /DNA_START=47 /DNA_END=1618 /DNA_ORIENTATION=- /assembly_acc=CAM_ASM_000762